MEYETMKKITPFGALLGTAALTMIASDMHRGAVNLPQPTFAAPGTAGPSNALDDRRTHAPANDTGHAPMTPTKMADPLRGAPMVAEGLGGGIGGKVETMLMVDAGDTGHLNAETGASLGQDVEAATNADFTAKQS
jgi:hypothetical protein